MRAALLVLLVSCDAGSSRANHHDVVANNAFILKLQFFVEQTCQCHDQACVRWTERDETEWSRSVTGDSVMDADDSARLSRLMDRYGQCVARAT